MIADVQRDHHDLVADLDVEKKRINRTNEKLDGHDNRLNAETDLVQEL
jgi:hypothetical protein